MSEIVLKQITKIATVVFWCPRCQYIGLRIDKENGYLLSDAFICDVCKKRFELREDL
jgi:uncharacterized protein YbaR (Trm112 family)